jgi:mono/diheme cytochrome c family protein
LAKPPRDLSNPEFHASVSDDDLRRVIRVGKNQMPAFGGLMGDEDLNNVIAFIRTLPPGARAPQPSALPPTSAVLPSTRAAPAGQPDRNGVSQ